MDKDDEQRESYEVPALNEAQGQFFAELRTENEKGCLDILPCM